MIAANKVVDNSYGGIIIYAYSVYVADMHI